MILRLMILKLKMNSQGLSLLIFVFILSWIYKTYFVNLIENIISMQSQCMVLMFAAIITQLDNITLYYDLNNKNNICEENDFYIKVIGNQAIQLEKNKIIIYNLIKFNEINIENTNNSFIQNRRLRQSNSF
jgi:hypothetical protein